MMNRFCSLVMLLAASAFLMAGNVLAQTPGTAPDGYSKSFGIEVLTPQVTETGLISLSIDGCGTNSPPCTIQVDKPAGGTVRSAFLASASTGFSGFQLPDGAVQINGTSVNWDINLANGISSWNHWADVTSIVKPIVDAAAAGLVDLSINETDGRVEANALAVIFDDPTATATKTAVLSFGAQATTGDSFNITLAEGFDPSEQTIQMSLGISFGFQRFGGGQISRVDVNGTRITSSAGGEDDGESANGALVTVGGIGDDPANPADPNAGPTNQFTDDELYTLDDFIGTGDTQILVETINPSNDDNIFFAAFCIEGAAAIVGEGILLTPTDATNQVGETHTVTAFVQDDTGAPVVGRDVDFEIISGPNAGLTGSGVTDANGEATFSWSSAVEGTDVVVARFTDSQDRLRTSNQATKRWVGEPVEECDPADFVSYDGSVLQVDGMTFLPFSAPQGFKRVEFTSTSNLAVLGIFDTDGTTDLGPSGTGDFSETFTNPPGDVVYDFVGDTNSPVTAVWVKVDAVDSGPSTFFVELEDLDPLCPTINVDPVIVVANEEMEVPSDFELGQNYPNPFNPTTSISFSIPVSSQVTLGIYDVLGREVNRLVDDHLSAGTHQVEWDGTDASGKSVASGTYLYRLDAGDYQSTKQMALLK